MAEKPHEVAKEPLARTLSDGLVIFLKLISYSLFNPNLPCFFYSIPSQLISLSRDLHLVHMVLRVSEAHYVLIELV